MAFDKPTIPASCNVCPVLGCHKATRYGGELCLLRLRSQLRKNPASLKSMKLANSAELAVEYVHKMAIESLSPDKYENLLDSLIFLCKTRKISNSLPSESAVEVPTGIQQQKDSIALAVDKFQELAGKNVEAEFSVGEIVDILEEIAQQKSV